MLQTELGKGDFKGRFLGPTLEMLIQPGEQGPGIS